MEEIFGKIHFQLFEQSMGKSFVFVLIQGKVMRMMMMMKRIYWMTMMN